MKMLWDIEPRLMLGFPATPCLKTDFIRKTPQKACMAISLMETLH